MADRIESKVSRTILQKTGEVLIGENTYQVAPPCIATIIEASELIAQLPTVYLNPDSILLETLYIAKDCRVLGDILAVLILGAKNLRTEKQVVKSRYFGLKKETYTVVVDNVAVLAKTLLLELSPSELHGLLNDILDRMEIGHFFGITTSLIEINLLKETREVEMKTTASGQ